jgi:hypothetical protein|tara:strand:- start:801 stop:1130 length:330 start_codon:yes stop_codon:yes gene_type:complete
MMNIWVLSGSYEGEQFASSHLTEKGAVLAAIGDVLQLLGVEDDEDARSVYARRMYDGKEKDVDPPEWDMEKMKSMIRNELWGIFNEWVELTWDNHGGYGIEVIKTQVQA